MGLFKKRAPVAEPPSQVPRFDRIVVPGGTTAHLARAGTLVPLCRPALPGARADIHGLRVCKLCSAIADEATK